jgi:hypothetical protein
LDRPRLRVISNDWPACRSKRTASASYSARPVDSLAWPGENLTVRPVASRELGMSRNTAPSRQCRCDPPPDLPGCQVSAWGALYTIAVCLFLGCLAFEEHVHLRSRRHAVHKGPKAVVPRPAASGGLFRLGCRLRIALRKPELPLGWSLRLRAIPCTVPCQGFYFPTIRASHHPLRLLQLSQFLFHKTVAGMRRDLLKSRLV